MAVEAPSVSRQEYTWEWDRREFIHVFRALLREARSGWVVHGVLTIGAAAVVIAVVLVADWLIAGRTQPAISLMAWLVLVIVWLGLLRWWFPRSGAQAFRRLHSGPLHLIIDAEGIDFGSEVSHVQVKWSAIQRIIEESDFFLLFFTGRRNGVYVPKRAMRGTEGVATFRALLRSAVGESAKLVLRDIRR